MAYAIGMEVPKTGRVKTGTKRQSALRNPFRALGSQLSCSETWTRGPSPDIQAMAWSGDPSHFLDLDLKGLSLGITWDTKRKSIGTPLRGLISCPLFDFR